MTGSMRSNHTSKKLEELLKLLDKKNEEPNNGEIESRFFNDVLEYLLNDSSDHWWCSEIEMPIAQESLWLFSLPDHDNINKYKERLGLQLRTCTRCLHNYYSSKPILRERYNNVFSAENVQSFFDILDRFDRHRVMTSLRRNIYIQREQNTSNPQSLSDTTICAVYDVLYAPQLLHQNDCDKLFCNLFDKMHESAIFPSVTTDVANGVILLAYHHHRIVRFWARKLLDKLATDQYVLEDPDTHVKQAPQYYANPPADFITNTIKLTSDIGERSKAFRATINLLGPDQLKKIMSDTTVSVQQWISQQFSNLASGNSNTVQETIRILTILLQKLGRNFWGNEVNSSVTHHNFLKRVCEDHGFQAIMKIARESNSGKVLQRDGTVYPEDKLIVRIKGMLGWIYFYWSALPDDVQDQTADSILKMLWGYFQLNSWSIICKACCAELGFKVIEDSLTRDSDKCPFDRLNEFASTAVWFASIPLMRLPQTFRHIPDLAARVLTQALRQDALNMRERIIAISQTNNSGQQQQQQQNSSRVGVQPVWQAIGEVYKQNSDGVEPRLTLLAMEGYSPLVIVDLPISNKKHPLYTSNKGSAMMKQVSTIRQIFSNILHHVTSDTTAAAMHERLKLYERSDAISSVLPLTCSFYVDEIRKPILQLLSVSNSNKNDLQEQLTLRHYVDQQPRLVLEALSVILDDFNTLAMPLVALDSFKLVGPLNQTLTHLISAIVGDEESYMLQLVIMGDYTSEEHRVIKQFWDTCWRTIALIFGKAKEWSLTHKSKEVVDATIALFDTAQMMIGARQVFQKAVDSSAPIDTDLSSFDDTSQLQYEHVKEAFDSLSQWITVTSEKVIQKLVPLIILILNHLSDINIKVPEDVCKRLTSAASGEIETRLLQGSKKSLLAALRPHQPEKIILYDSDEEENWQLVEPSHYTSPPQFDYHQNNTTGKPPKITSYFSKVQDDISFNDDDIIFGDYSTANESAPFSSSNAQHVGLTNEIDNKGDDGDDEFMDEFGDLDISALPDEWFEGAITSSTSSKLESSSGRPTTLSRTESVSDSNNNVTVQPSKKSIAAAIQAQQTELWKQYEDQKAKEQLAQQQRQRQQQQWSSTFTPKTQKPQVYAVTSTGRKLRPPPTGFSKLKALRAEFKAENKLIAASKSPSASASARNRNRNSCNSNSDSSSDSSDDDDNGLQGLVDVVDQSKTKRGGEVTEQDKFNRADEERASMKALFGQPVKRSTKMIETKATQAYLEKKQLIKRAEARRKKITPDIDRFFRAILSWDITVNSEIPPSAYKGMYNKVGDRFNTYEDYLLNFEPLLLLEVWMQLLRARDALTENDVIDRCVLDSRVHVNDFVDVTFGVPLSSVNSLIIDDFVCVANHFSSEFFKRHELDSVSKNEPPQPTSYKGRCFLGKVMTVTQKKSISEVTLRCFFSPDRIILLNSLSPKTSWRMLKLTSITTFQREYAALQGLQHYDLAQHILNPKQYRMPTFADHMVDKCIEKYGVNDPQARAILGALDKKRGFTLIQGPPGTGKTKTILGLIVSLLDEQRDRKRQKERGTRIDTDGSEYTGEAKILVCAPSNAAVDEIAKRLQEGIMTSQGLSKPKIVRIGTPEAANVSVREILLDRLVEKELAPTIGNTEEAKNFGERRGKLNEDIRKVQLDIDDIDREMSECQGGSAEVVAQLTALKEKRKECVDKRNKYKYMIKGILEAQRDFTREQELSRHRARQKVFANVDIVCATLSGSGNDMLTSMGLMFDTVVVDEAAQSVEISSLIPLKYDCQRCILVGDPNQLPPTVLSQMAAKYSYEQSLFMRLQKNAPDNVYLLSIQYRMHPEISRFPSKLFYESRLLDGPDMEVTTAAPWHSQEYFPPYRFYNVEDGMEKTGYGKSIYNTAEAEAALALVDMLASRLPNVKFAYRIGIITPYKQQLSHIKHRFERRYGPKILDVIDFNTVDGFQGQEKDIIIFSCVRALSERGIGFLADMRRMNVGLTRAKSSLFVLGHKNSLMKSEYWGDLVRDAIDRETIVNIRPPYFNYRLISHKSPPNLFEKEIKPTVAARKLPPRSKAQSIPLPRVSSTTSDSSSNEKRSHPNSPTPSSSRSSSTAPTSSRGAGDDQMVPRIKKIRTSPSDSDILPDTRSIVRNNLSQSASVLPVIPDNRSIARNSDSRFLSSVPPDIRSISREDPRPSVLPISKQSSREPSPNRSPPKLIPSKRHHHHRHQHHHHPQSSYPADSHPSKLRRPPKMTLAEYNARPNAGSSRPPPSSSSPSSMGGAPSLYIQKRKAPLPRSGTQSRNYDEPLNARDRVFLEHQAAKDAMREIRRSEQQKSASSARQTQTQLKKFDDLLDDIHHYRR